MRRSGEFDSKASNLMLFESIRLLLTNKDSWQVATHRYAENVQTEEGIKKVREWAISSNQELDSDDLFISGNVDEVVLPF